MGRTLKIVGIVVGVLIVLVVVVPFLVPVNQFRPTIEQKASAALGRKVEVGNLSFSLLSGSLGADNLAIADDPKFSNAAFLSAKSVKVGVEVMPLIFSKTLNVTDIAHRQPASHADPRRQRRVELFVVRRFGGKITSDADARGR